MKAGRGIAQGPRVGHSCCMPAVNLGLLARRLPPSPLTRFAPSPTGYLHLGHVANAIFVWGIARTLSGRVLLRIEDHDRGGWDWLPTSGPAAPRSHHLIVRATPRPIRRRPCAGCRARRRCMPASVPAGPSHVSWATWRAGRPHIPAVAGREASRRVPGGGCGYAWRAPNGSRTERSVPRCRFPSGSAAISCSATGWASGPISSP